jgi:uncharacterized membrane protein
VAAEIQHLRGAFGQDRFGKAAERFARFFGTPRFIVGQTVVVAIWIAINGLVVAFRWDPYPFILLNLAFSTQAAYAAPLILLAQTRQADRDAHHTRRMEQQHEKQEKRHNELLAQNHELVAQVEQLTEQIKAALDR